MRRLLLEFRKPWLARRVRRPVLEEVDGVHLVIFPSVHNPVVFRSGVFLAQTAAAATGRDMDVLDMGTGSGICAIFTAQAGGRVVAVDINPAAVCCARANAILNGVDAHLTVVEGDLFVPVAGRLFDLVLFNPPFYVGSPANMADRAWRGADVLSHFAAGLHRVLKRNGRALVVFSSDGDEEECFRAFDASPCNLEAIDRRDLGNEVFTIYSVTANIAGP